jgi:hypothetical protein
MTLLQISYKGVYTVLSEDQSFTTRIPPCRCCRIEEQRKEYDREAPRHEQSSYESKMGKVLSEAAGQEMLSSR